jgi:hypothetical protein
MKAAAEIEIARWKAQQWAEIEKIKAGSRLFQVRRQSRLTESSRDDIAMSLAAGNAVAFLTPMPPGCNVGAVPGR